MLFRIEPLVLRDFDMQIMNLLGILALSENDPVNDPICE
jgi:hypothetical protein